MKNWKPGVLTGLVAVALATTTLAYGASTAAMAADNNGVIILAQNQEQGFWGRLFNKPGDSAKAENKPIFTSRPNQAKVRERDPVKPYEFEEPISISNHRNSLNIEKIIEADMARVAKLEKRVNQQSEQTRAKVNKSVEQVRLRREQRIAAREAASGKGNSKAATGNVRMIYDPSRVWSYDPNQRKDQGNGAPQLFNSR